MEYIIGWLLCGVIAVFLECINGMPDVIRIGHILGITIYILLGLISLLLSVFDMIIKNKDVIIWRKDD